MNYLGQVENYDDGFVSYDKVLSNPVCFYSLNTAQYYSRSLYVSRPAGNPGSHSEFLNEPGANQTTDVLSDFLLAFFF